VPALVVIDVAKPMASNAMVAFMLLIISPR
jgi:hypothetical protein